VDITVGQTVSISIALVFRYIPMNTALRTSLATALAVASMVKLGVTHPPAGAATVIFVTNSTLSWGSMGFMLIADLLAIGSATLINNISEKRQYPTFWGLGFLEGSTDYLRLRNDDKAQQETTKRS
jgi:CBS-domain-containing membrane protein